MLIIVTKTKVNKNLTPKYKLYYCDMKKYDKLLCEKFM